MMKGIRDFKGKQNMGILGNPVTSTSSEKFLVKFLKILTSICNEIFVINDGYPKNPDDRIHIIKIRYISKGRIRALNYVTIQILQCIHLIKIRRKIDVLFVLTTFSLLPIVTAKILGKKTIVMVAQDPVGTGSDIYSYFLKMTRFLCFKLPDRIIVESPNVASSWKLDKYKEKVCLGAIYVDIWPYRIKKPVENRLNIVGYIGNLTERKGIKQLATAILEIINKNQNVRFLIGGQGPLEGHVRFIAEKYYTEVQYVGRVPEIDLPNILNELKLLVLPSYTEGLPNIVLEAMACGTPVLATPVGAIPDIIKDEENGFIMENNSSECIANNILRALNYPKLPDVAKSARFLIERECSYEAAVYRFKHLLATLS